MIARFNRRAPFIGALLNPDIPMPGTCSITLRALHTNGQPIIGAVGYATTVAPKRVNAGVWVGGETVQAISASDGTFTFAGVEQGVTVEIYIPAIRYCKNIDVPYMSSLAL